MRQGFAKSGYSYDQIDALRQLAQREGSGGQAIFNGAAGEAISNTFISPAVLPASGLPQGLQFFDFDQIGRRMYPQISILRNRIPRIKARGVQMYWREITGLNTGKVIPGVSEGNRGAVIARTSRDRSAGFAGLGYEDVSTFEAEYAARGVANPRELARIDALQALQMAEERIILYGNRSIALGTPAAPAGVPSAGGSMTSRTIVGRIVAMTGEGKYLSSSNALATTVSRTNADASVDTIGGGSSIQSAASAGVVVPASGKVAWAWNDVPGASYYGLFTGVAGSERLAAIVSTNEYEQLTDESGAAQLSSVHTSDNSINALEFDGILTQIQKSWITDGVGYYKSLDGASLTSDATGNITELIAAFFHYHDVFQAGVDELMMDPATAYDFTKILLNGASANMYQGMVTQNTNIKGGFAVTQILNPFTMQYVKVTVHPYMPKGTIVIFNEALSMPIPDAGGALWEMHVRQEYYAIDWPLRTRKDECGVYVDEGLVSKVPEMQGIIKNIQTTL